MNAPSSLAVLSEVSPLSGREVEQLKDNARKYALAKLGPRPDRKSVNKDLGSLLGPEDYLAAVVFLASFAVSAIHITSLVGKLAQGLATGAATTGGIDISASLFIIAHQIAFTLLAEFAMILFMVRWRLFTRRREAHLTEIYGDGSRPRGSFLGKFLSVDLLLSLLAVGFTLYANLESKLPPLESVMPPLFTIGIGIHLEHVFVELIHRQGILRDALAAAESKWQAAYDGILVSKQYNQALSRMIYDKHVANWPWVADQPPDIKWALVERDLAADRQFDKYLQLAEQTSPATMASLSQGGEWTLKGLVQATVAASESETGRLEVGSHWVDLGQLTWYNGDKGKQYGPYKGRGNMIAAMKMSSDRGVTSLQTA